MTVPKDVLRKNEIRGIGIRSHGDIQKLVFFEKGGSRDVYKIACREFDQQKFAVRIILNCCETVRSIPTMSSSQSYYKQYNII